MVRKPKTAKLEFRTMIGSEKVPARVLLLNSVNVKMDIGVTRVHTKTKTKEHRMSGSPMIGDYQIQRGFPPGGTRFTKFLNPNLNWTKYNKSFLTNTEY